MDKSRLFIAINIDHKTRDSLNSVQSKFGELIKGDALRFISPSNIHLTLHFFGNISTNKIPEIEKLMKHVANLYYCFKFTIKDLGVFPNKHNPRVLWADIFDNSRSLIKLQQKLIKTLDENNFKVENRPFAPHLTLAYVKKQASRKEQQLIGKSIKKIDYPPIKNCNVESIDLVKSTLNANGSIYSTIYKALLNKSSAMKE